jgi:murein DD-endopeptidase MepM/ murein hydrolase activator NlpD
VWADVVASGWHEVVFRYATHALLLVVLAAAIPARRVDVRPALAWVTARASLHAAAGLAPSAAGEAPAAKGGAAGGPAVVLPLAAALPQPPAPGEDVWRAANLHTLIPTRGRSEVIDYTVQPGDTLFGIAERYGLKPETLLWGNYFTLKDDPHSLMPGQVLKILPVDGAYHYVTPDNTLEKIASFYGVEPQAITDWPSNNLDPNRPVLQPDTFLVIPGGHRELTNWTVPTITRGEKATAVNNFGQCPGGYSGAVGTGAFVWPADRHFLSGYDYTSIHHGLDIKAKLGDPIYAVDSGVVVYAGPNDYGYGNLVVIDHGNGWQSAYAHLSQWNVVCGQSVFQAGVIGLAGSTGRSSGPHLHFELRYNGGRVNPWSVLPAP